MITVDKVRDALRISVADNTAINGELADLINAALLDLRIAGVEVPATADPLVNTAVITYCKMRFGLPEDYDRLKKSYDEQKAQLSNATGYTVWEV